MIVTRTAENERTLRGKAFECFNLVASAAVGKENSAADCHEVMQIIVPLLQAGFPDDKQTREYIQEVYDVTQWLWTTSSCVVPSSFVSVLTDCRGVLAS